MNSNVRDDRMLPQNLDSERCLLGSIMLDNDVMFDVLDIVTADDFFEPGNGELFKLMRDMIESDRVALPGTLLADAGHDRDIGFGLRSSEYLHQLFNEGVPAPAAKEIARGIADNALKRRLIAAGRQMVNDAFDAPTSMGGAYLRDKYDSTFGALFPTLKELGVRHVGDYGDSVLSYVDAAVKHDADAGLALGLSEIQNLIGALLPGRLYAIAGASGSGKSAITQQVLEYITAPDRGKVALWIQAEMEGEEVAARAITAATMIPGENIERAMINDDEFGRMVTANDAMRKHHLYVDAGTLPTMARIRSRAQRMKLVKGLDVLAIDHLLYLGKPNDKMEDIQAIPYNMREAKALAKDLHIPVLMLMPLKSAYHEGEVRRPRMSDLTHPAAIDQNSDVILFVSRPEYILGRNEPDANDEGRAEWQQQMDRWKGRAEAILTKRRGGKGFGVRPLWFDERRVRFEDNEPKGLRYVEAPVMF